MMTRRLLALVLLALVLSSVLLVARTPVVNAQDPNGCANFSAGMPTTIPEGFTVPDPAYFGTFKAGDVLRVEVLTGEPDVDVKLVIVDNSNTTSTISANPVATFTVSSNGNLLVSISNTVATQDAGVTVSCSPAPPTPTFGPSATPSPGPSPTASPVPSAAPGQWAGYVDGRLGAAPDEYYSIWCQNGYVTVYRSINGQGDLLARIAAIELAAMPIGSRKQLVDPSRVTFNVERQTQEMFTFFGANGNGAPATGSKTVNLMACTPPVSLVIPTVAPTSAPVIQVVVLPGTATASPVPPTPTATQNPQDLDGDTVINRYDLCPTFDNRVIEERLRFAGCADLDGDRFADPTDAAGNFVLNSGNPLSLESSDSCPGIFGANRGCPAVPTIVAINVGGTFNPEGNYVVPTPDPAFTGVWQSVTLGPDAYACAKDDTQATTTTNFLGVETCTFPRVMLREAYNGKPAGVYGNVAGRSSDYSLFLIEWDDGTTMERVPFSVLQFNGEDLSSVPVKYN